MKLSEWAKRHGVCYKTAWRWFRDGKLPVVVAEETESQADLWQDFTDVVTSMCARIYGQRGAKNRAARALLAAKEDAD